MMVTGTISEVPPARAEVSGAIGSAAPTRMGAVLSCVLHGLAVLSFLTFGLMQGNAGATDNTVTVELIKLAPPPAPVPETAPPPQPEPQIKPTPAPPAVTAKPQPKRAAVQPAAPTAAPAMTESAASSAPPSTTEAPAASASSFPAAPATAKAGPPDDEMRAYNALVWNKVMGNRPNRIRLAGTVRVRFSLTAGGGLVSAEIIQSSGSDFLDGVALEAVGRAAPFPPPPAGADTDARTFLIPFHFR